jgi:methionine sulfoxide reductase heme-binding subunit
MTKRTRILLKILAWLACLTPWAITVSDALTNRLGPDATKAIIHSTGTAALYLLMISLVITPLRRLSPRLSWLIHFRRLLGLFAFFYASLHLLTYISLYAYFNFATVLDDVTRRKFIFVGTAAWALMIPLAITSTTGWIRRLGGRRWNLLHKLVYLSVTLGLIHYWWQVKRGVLTPLPETVALTLIFLARPATAWWAKHRTTRAA